MRNTILVTGGHGFVGRSVLRILERAGHDIVVVDIADTESTGKPASRHAQVDIRDEASLKALFDTVQPAAIIHLAAVHFIPLCEANPHLAVSTNTLGTVNLLRLAPEGCRFVFASSAAVYAPSPDLHVEDMSPIGPLDVYGLTKLDGERYVQYFAAHRKLQGVNIRLFNVVGPGETNPHLLPDILAQVRSGRREITLGNLFPKRDYIHVDDAAAAFVAAATTGTVEAGTTTTINVGTSVQHSVVDAVRLIEEVAGVKLKILQDTSKLRASDRPFLGADIRRAAETFNWFPRFTLRDALREAWIEPRFSAALNRLYGLT